MESNEIILHITTNGWSRQTYAQCFDFEVVIFIQDINMFENMKITESIYEGVVENYHKKTNRE